MRVYPHDRPRNTRISLTVLGVLGLGALGGLLWSSLKRQNPAIEPTGI